MPQPKGYEPYCPIWTVRYNVIVQYGSTISAGTFASRPRIRILTSALDASSLYQSLVSLQQVKAGYPAPGTIQQPFLEKFYNKRTFIKTFVQEHADMLNTGA